MAETSNSFRRDAHGLEGSISLSEIVSALSFALEQTEGAVPGHTLRSCLLGMRIGAEAKLAPEQAESLYFALLLKDVGSNVDSFPVSEPHNGAGTKLEQLSRSKRPLDRFQGFRLPWRSGARDLRPSSPALAGVDSGFHPSSVDRDRINLRRDRGARILRKLGVGEPAVQAVRNLEERWDGAGYPDRLMGEQIPLLSRICAVAQQLDAAAVLYGEQRAVDVLQERSGSWFDPVFVHIASSLHRSGSLWTECSPADYEPTRQAVLDLDNGRRHDLESSRIDQICEAFADVVDAKSHFTFRHSLGVADAALGIAQDMALRGDRMQLVRRAALLHDIGKLSVSNRILDKKTGLDSAEWSAVYRHPSVTRLILERVAPFREIAVIAGEHHEKLDGSGYPHRLEAKDLSLESRIIAVADVYGALSEDRPYRPGLMLDEIVSIMAKLVPHQLDADCFDALISVISKKRGISFVCGPQLPGSPLVYAI